MSFCPAVTSDYKIEQGRNVEKTQYLQLNLSCFLFIPQTFITTNLHKYHTDTTDNLTDKNISDTKTEYTYP